MTFYGIKWELKSYILWPLIFPDLHSFHLTSKSLTGQGRVLLPHRLPAGPVLPTPGLPSGHTRSRKTSLLVNLRTAVSVSCTMPMTGRLLWGVTIMRGTMASSWISARVSRDCGRCKFISSPSKSALYGVVTLQRDTRQSWEDADAAGNAQGAAQPSEPSAGGLTSGSSGK